MLNFLRIFRTVGVNYIRISHLRKSVLLIPMTTVPNDEVVVPLQNKNIVVPLQGTDTVHPEADPAGEVELENSQVQVPRRSSR